MKALLRSPAHYQAYLNGRRKETPAQYLGSAVHARLLEPERFAAAYIVAPELDKRSRAWKDFAAAAGARPLLSAAQAAIVGGIAREVAQHPTASALLRGGLPEQTFIWQDQHSGIWLKVRPDCLHLGAGMCLDVKTTEDASPDAFARACVSLDYDLQSTVYLEGLRAILGRDMDFCFLAVEKSELFGMALYGAPEEMIERGQRHFRTALRRLQACRQTDRWPGYQEDGFDILSWPKWAR